MQDIHRYFIMSGNEEASIYKLSASHIPFTLMMNEQHRTRTGIKPRHANKVSTAT